MGKISNVPAGSTLARVMHNIGGLSGKNDNSDMIVGGEEVLTLVSPRDIPDHIDVERLFEVGALRQATSDEVVKWEVQTGVRDMPTTSEAFTAFTTGSPGGAVGAENASIEPGTVNNGGQEDLSESEKAASEDGSSAVVGSAGHQTYKGMGKGDLSEYTVPELKAWAKEEGIEGYQDMLKADLLDALLATGK